MTHFFSLLVEQLSETSFPQEGPYSSPTTLRALAKVCLSHDYPVTLWRRHLFSPSHPNQVSAQQYLYLRGGDEAFTGHGLFSAEQRDSEIKANAEQYVRIKSKKGLIHVRFLSYEDPEELCETSVMMTPEQQAWIIEFEKRLLEHTIPSQDSLKGTPRL